MTASFTLSCEAPKPQPIAARGTVPPPADPHKLKVLCIAAHPDDAESGCGGTLAKYAAAGHAVHVLYITKGEVGIEGKTPEETAKIRGGEAEEACKILGATPHFFGHAAGTLVFSWDLANELAKKIDEIGPDVIFGHWPFDTNYDHEVAAMLTSHAYLMKPRAHPLYLFEVETGSQSLGFEPKVFVEISSVLQKKIDAIGAHKSQYASERLYERHHEKMEKFRAREIGGTAAEAFATLAPEERHTGVPGLP